LTPFARRRKVNSKHHGTVNESSLEQQIHVTMDYTFVVIKNWICNPSTTGFYGRLADRQNSAKFIKLYIPDEIFNFSLHLTKV